MPMTLYFKRAKAFVQSDDNGTRKFLAVPGPSPVPVPFWVADTPTFKQGIKDASIVNLTPPDQMPGYKHPALVEKSEKAEKSSKKGVEAEGEEEPQQPAEKEEEQNEVPQVPFGGQPMTPVPPAPKVGGITANSRKSK